MHRQRTAAVGLALTVLPLAGLLGCTVLGGGGGTDTSSVAVQVSIERDGAFRSMTLHTPGTIIKGGFIRASFQDSGGTDQIAESDDRNTGTFLNTGTTLEFAPRPEVPFPPGGGTGTIQFELSGDGITFSNTAGAQINVAGPVVVEYEMTTSEQLTLPDTVSALEFPASGAAISEFRFAASGMAPNTQVTVRLGYETEGGAGAATMTGQADQAGSASVTSADATVITGITTIRMTFAAP